MGEALCGIGRSPSLVWHAQTIGGLLEFGYLPTTEAIRKHLEVLRWRLGPDCCRDPMKHKSRDPWLLRTRHVAWVVACLAELPTLEIASREEEHLRADLERGMKLHREIVAIGLSYLLGPREAGGPSEWTGFDEQLRGWHEHWGEDELNALNSLYSMVAVCRAERHGWLEPDRDRESAPPVSLVMLDELFEEVVVVTDDGRPEVRWDHGWPEPWAGGDLPDSIVALFVICLLEYAGVLREMSPPRGPNEARGAVMRDKARRLAEVLVFRALDRSSKAKGQPVWTSAVDAFIRPKAGGEWSERGWFMPSYSLGVRAVLEAGVVSPFHRVVRDAFETITRLALPLQTLGGERMQTWVDPTRARAVHDEAVARSGENWHARVGLRDVLAETPRRSQVTPAGLHAAAMAWGALRRAAARIDPEELLTPLELTGRAATVFTSVELDPPPGGGGDVELRLRSAADYEEEASISAEWSFVLLALADGARDESRLIEKINELADSADRVRRAKTAAGLRSAANGINRKFGVDLITWSSSESGRVYEVKPSVQLRPRRPASARNRA